MPEAPAALMAGGLLALLYEAALGFWPLYSGGQAVLQWGTCSEGVLEWDRTLVCPRTLGRRSGNLAQMRASILLELFTSVGIIVLASLLYVVPKDQNRMVALVALGWWLAEAVT